MTEKEPVPTYKEKSASTNTVPEPLPGTTKGAKSVLNRPLMIGIVLIVVLLLIGGLTGYIYRDSLLKLFKKVEIVKEKELPAELLNTKSFIYIPASPELTGEQWEQLIKSNYTVTIFEQKTNFPAGFLRDYAVKHFIAIKVTSPEQLSEDIRSYSKYFFLEDISKPICDGEYIKCGTYQEQQAVNFDTAKNVSSSLLSGKKKTKFYFQNKFELFSLEQTCSATELSVCQKVILIDSVKLNELAEIPADSSLSVAVIGSEGKILDPFINALPKLHLSTKIDQVPLFLWEDGTSSPLFVQTGYSLAVSNKTANAIIFKSGKINGTNQGDYFLPINQPNTNDFTLYLKVWYTYGAITIDSPISAQIGFSFEYKPVEVETNIPGSVQQIAWIPDWGLARGLESFKKNPKKWAAISPVWWALNGNGSLTAEKSINHAELLSVAKKNGVTVIPTVSQFDPDVMEDMLNNHMEEHIQTILALVRNNNYAGIDLDYESTYLKDKALFEQFITRLASELHKGNKILVFTVLPKWTDEKINSFLPQTKQVQDWAFLGKHVDEVRIMGYDFTGEGSHLAGPISPIIWDEMIIKYALTKLPPEKIVLALPLYSHAWIPSKENDPAGPNNDKVINSGNTGTQSLQHAEISELKRKNRSYKEALDLWTYEIRAEFTGTKGKYVMYYQDKNAINKRLDLAKKYKIKGIAYWRIGGEEL